MLRSNIVWVYVRANLIRSLIFWKEPILGTSIKRSHVERTHLGSEKQGLILLILSVPNLRVPPNIGTRPGKYNTPSLSIYLEKKLVPDIFRLTLFPLSGFKYKIGFVSYGCESIPFTSRVRVVYVYWKRLLCQDPREWGNENIKILSNARAGILANTVGWIHFISLLKETHEENTHNELIASAFFFFLMTGELKEFQVSRLEPPETHKKGKLLNSNLSVMESQLSWSVPYYSCWRAHTS